MVPEKSVCNIEFFEEKIIIDKSLIIFYINSVAIIHDSFHSNEVVGQVPLYWNELANKSLKFLNHHIGVVAAGKTVNRGFSLGLEIPVNYLFHGDN